jgi:hypothetical protein
VLFICIADAVSVFNNKVIDKNILKFIKFPQKYILKLIKKPYLDAKRRKKSLRIKNIIRPARATMRKE